MDDMTWPGSSLGILYAEDFDEAAAVAEPEAPPAFPAALTQDDVDAACAAAVQEAQARWDSSLAQQRAGVLAGLGAQLEQARADDRQETAALAEAMAEAALAMLAGALPGLCRSHGDAEVRALVRQLLPGLQRETRVVVRVHSGLVAALQQDFALLDGELADGVTVTAAPLPPGDVRVTWAGGSCTRDTARILQGMEDALSQLGLLTQAPQRRMALAG